MPFRHLPDSVNQRLAAMHGAYTKWIATAAGDRLITPEHFADLDLTDPDSLHSRYKKDMGESSAALAVQASRTSEHDATNGALAQVISHFIQVFNFAVTRGKFDRSDRAYYGLDVNRADVPPLSSRADVDQWAHKLIDGEAARLNANPAATAMAMPAIGEINAALAQVEASRESQTIAKDAYDLEQSDLETSNPAVNTLILDIWDTVEFKLRTLDGPSRRRRAREWGLVYLTRPGEPPDPELPATPEDGAAPPTP